MRISDWSSDLYSSDLRYIHIPLCSSAGFCDLLADFLRCPPSGASAWIGAIEIAEMPPWIRRTPFRRSGGRGRVQKSGMAVWRDRSLPGAVARNMRVAEAARCPLSLRDRSRSEEHTSELQSLMRISYAVFCLKKKKDNNQI